jgi:hypothetical protein
MNARLAALKLNQNKILTNLGVGYSQAPYVGKMLFPEVSVDDTNISIPSYAKDLFRVYKTERAIRAEAQILDAASYDKTDIVLQEHSLAQKLDTWEIAASESQKLDLLKFSATQVLEGLQIGEEARIADMVQNLTTFPTGHKVTLSGDTQWTDTDSSPLTQIDTAKEAISDAVGHYPTVMVLGSASFNSLKNHKEVRDRVFGFDKPGIPTIADLEKLLDIKIYVGRAHYATSATSQFYKIWEDNCILAYVPQTASEKSNIYKPSFAYSFKHKGFPFVQDYFTSGNNKIKMVESTSVTAVSVLMSNAGYLIKDTNA